MAKKVLRWGGLVVGGLLALALGVYGWASWAAAATFDRTVEVHDVEFPVPFPLSEAELDELRAERIAAWRAEHPTAEPTDGAEDDEGEAPAPPEPPADLLAGLDLMAIARERARARGEHLVRSRYACGACHGEDLGGGTMIEDPMLGSIHGTNLTGGAGGRVAEYGVRDWDHAVRHGLLPGGRPSIMPAEDYRRMTDHELSDLIVYIRSVAPVDRDPPPRSFGPLGKLLLATGQIPLAADRIDHQVEHAEHPPEAAESVDFGEHLAAICVGCHGDQLAGGPMAGGDPSWPPAANLTQLHDWTFDQFREAMVELRRPDGSAISPPMNEIQPFIARMEDVEMRALWMYLDSLEPLPTPE